MEILTQWIASVHLPNSVRITEIGWPSSHSSRPSMTMVICISVDCKRAEYEIVELNGQGFTSYTQIIGMSAAFDLEN
jgi:hypothetical protein